ncbi:MAG TPA: hypothetical protein PLP83_02600 [Candidatus Aminicenantes bacterium]|nr:hypothetical protein [Candidatus Aminicenantes bacterium]
MRRPRLPCLTVLFAGILLGAAASGQVAAPPGDFPMRTFFSVRSARLDDSVPDILREQFEKDEGGPLRSVSIDLDGDGRDEKFVLSSKPTSGGGYQWLVYDQARGVGRGIVVGAIVFVGRETDGGYPRLETCWKQGGDMSVVFRYAFDRTRYGRTATRALTLWETSEYFRAKPPLDLERELVETEARMTDGPEAAWPSRGRTRRSP